MAKITESSKWRYHDRRKNSGFFDFSVDVSEFVDDIDILDDRVRSAVNSALVKTGRWLVTHSVRGIAKEVGIKQKPIKDRFRVERVSDGVRIWVGLLEIDLNKAGVTTQNAAGVKGSGGQYDRAFKRVIYGSDERVYIRASANRTEGHSVVREKRSRKPVTAGSFIEKNRGRFPVQAIGIDIEEVGQSVLVNYEAQINRRFKEIFDQELNYRFGVLS